MTDVFATAADAAYGYHAVNLIGSVLRNSDIFDHIEVFDLGLSPHQRGLLEAVPGVVVREVPPFSPHWAQCFTWKPWAWLQIDADRVFWIDAGASVLRSLAHALDEVAERDYFLVSQGGRLSEILPRDYFERYAIANRFAAHPYVAAGVLGFSPRGEFFDRVLVPTYEDCLAGLNLGFSPDEVATKNRGLGYSGSPLLRDCAHFRWDQSVLNAHLFHAWPHAEVANLDEYGGWRSPHDHPRQVIWHHRRRAGLRYLTRVAYRGDRARRRRAWAAWWRLRWWFVLKKRFFQPTTYLLKAQALRRGVRS